MPDDVTAYAKLLEQHNDLLKQLIILQGQVTVLWLAFVVLVFLQIIFIVAMVWSAVWSVRSVLKSNSDRMGQLEAQWMDHKGEIRTALDTIVRTLRGRDDVRRQPG
jgi:Flp pilus assembly protein TadB